jgi:urease accessory protein
VRPREAAGTWARIVADLEWTAMPWHAKLQLQYTHDGTGTSALDRHEGPLRVLQRLYPEGPGICHHVLVHPPGGVVGGDVLELDATLERNCHALITTPGATRFYRSAGDTALQQVLCRLAEGARLEWLPMETIAYSACQAHNRLNFNLSPGAETIGWDLLALGLPAAGQPFERGRFVQELELPGAWLERGRIDATDFALLDSPLGWAGRRVLATMWFAAGSALAPARRDALLDVSRACVAGHAELSAHAGATAPHERVVVLRALTHRVEPAMQLFKQVWAAWRGATWQLDATAPRLWRT